MSDENEGGARGGVSAMKDGRLQVRMRPGREGLTTELIKRLIEALHSHKP